MVTAKLAFALVQVGSNLWVNPMQLQGIRLPDIAGECRSVVIIADQFSCSDWSIDKVKEALSSSSVLRAMEGK